MTDAPTTATKNKTFYSARVNSSRRVTPQLSNRTRSTPAAAVGGVGVERGQAERENDEEEDSRRERGEAKQGRRTAKGRGGNG